MTFNLFLLTKMSPFSFRKKNERNKLLYFFFMYCAFTNMGCITPRSVFGATCWCCDWKFFFLFLATIMFIFFFYFFYFRVFFKSTFLCCITIFTFSRHLHANSFFFLISSRSFRCARIFSSFSRFSWIKA